MDKTRLEQSLDNALEIDFKSFGDCSWIYLVPVWHLLENLPRPKPSTQS